MTVEEERSNLTKVHTRSASATKVIPRDRMPRIPFALEEDLCGVLSPELSRIIGLQSRATRTLQLAQRPVGTVVPDFIFIRFQATPTDKHTRSEGLTALESWIVSTLLHGGPLTVEMIAHKLYMRTKRIDSCMLALRKEGIVEERPSGEFALRRGAIPSRCHVVAIEAKLRRWREALAQAAKYRTFANQSYVALPATLVDRNSGLTEACQDSGVGIIAVGGKSASVALEAPTHQTRSPDWVWLLSRTVGVGKGSGA